MSQKNYMKHEKILEIPETYIIFENNLSANKGHSGI